MTRPIKKGGFRLGPMGCCLLLPRQERRRIQTVVVVVIVVVGRPKPWAAMGHADEMTEQQQPRGKMGREK